MKEMQGNIKKNTILNMIKTLASILFPLVTFPYISRVLQPENVGKINFGSSIVSYFTLTATLGVTTYAVRECSRVRKEKDALERTASEILSINLCTMLISYILLIACLLLIPKLRGYRLLIAIQSLSIFFTIIGADWLNTAMEDFSYITLRTLLVQAIALILLFLFVRHKTDYYKFALITVLSASGGNLANMFYRKRYGEIRFTAKFNWRKHFPPILLLFAMMISQTILGSIDVTMLGFLKGDYTVGLYSTAMKVVAIVTQVVTSICWVVMPQLSEAFACESYEKINSLLHRAVSFSITLTLPCVAGLMLLSKEIVQLVGGRSYTDATLCLRILSLSTLLNVASGIWGNMILLPAKREKQFTYACIAGMLSNILINAICIPLFGMNGASVSTVISAGIILLGTMQKRDARIHIGRWREMLKAPVIGTSVILIAGTALGQYITGLLPRVALILPLCILLYGGTLLLLKNELAIQFIQIILSRITRKKRNTP